MQLPRYSMMILLFEIVNSPFSKPADFELAKFFLLHREKVCDLSIYDVAEECYVSRSTIRRFCEKLGFPNFTSFKQELEIPYDGREFENETKQEPYLEKHFGKIYQILDEIQNSTIIQSQCQLLAKQMHEHQNIFFVVSNSSASFVKDFQQQLLFQNCFLTIVTSNPIERIRTIYQKEHTIIVVISNSGVYVNMVYPELAEFSCPKYLLTCQSFAQEDVFQDIIYMSKQHQPSETDVVLYRKYALSLLFDMIYYYYVSEISVPN